MGSLMAGWDSRVRDPKSINLKRNLSMTNEEIANYWRSKKNDEQVHAGVLTSCQTFSMENYKKNELEKIYGRSNSLPITKEYSVIETSEEEEEDEEKLFKSHGWWINSRWAFLNEPPVIASETPVVRYASQFHVAQKHINASDHHAATNGIRT
ncbi:uncharacterized protein LOC111881993 [Lactuca sativa]|uniref:Uncharacterized protein n=1 Tax=Lactuca sativa TaxID=4236 RepID=A0A9R1VGI7_LACSA|nr:uncharacterized protein LOC111881993 [Lactuca sativa]KAJ0204326.1 hypothetical protein LSAT_V11C500238750 [Lactuca sativa]